MKAWLQTGYGGVDVLQRADVDEPAVGPDQVIVRVLTCAINRLDLIQRAGPPIMPDRFQLPHIAGMGICGEVIEVGDPIHRRLVGRTVVVEPAQVCGTCDDCARGDRKYCQNMRTVGVTLPGGYADLVAVRAANCIPIDLDRVDSEVAASIPVGTTTAWHAIVTAGGLSAGETVLIPAAGSGVGSAAIQIAKAIGCTVITTVGSAAKAERARVIGADHVVVRTQQPVVDGVREFTRGRGVDLVLDHVGGAFLQTSIDSTRRGGRVVLCGTTDGPRSTISLSSVYHWGRTLIGHGMPTPGEYRDVVAAVVAGRITPVVDRVLPMDELPAAQEHVESGTFFGKVVMTNV